MDVGFIGLGRMGQALAGRLLETGHSVAVYNRTRAKAEAVADAEVVDSIAEVCDGRAVVITMVANDEALDQVALGPGGVRDSLATGAIHVCMGTHGVVAIDALDDAHRRAGQAFVAAPVLGRPEVAAQGRLGIVAAGPPEALETCRPVFEAVGRRTFPAGERPAGASAVKLANNFVLGCAIEAMGEAFTLVRTYGIEAQVLQEVMTDGLFAAPAYETYGQIIVDGSFDRVGFTVTLALKDVNLILAAAERAHVPLPSASTYRDRLLTALAHGEGELDWAVLSRQQARASGLE